MAPGDLTLEAATQTKNESALFLKFQNHQADYLIFYDAEGSTLLLRYRKDRWDYDNDDLRDSLRQGVTYKLLVSNLKKLEEGQIPAGVAGAGLPRVRVLRPIRKIRDLFAGDIRYINESALRDLRY